MWLYWIYKVENYVERERVMLFRKKYYSRNHLRAYLMFFGEVSSGLPDTSKPECEDWDIPQGLLDSRIATLDEFIATEKEQKIEFESSKVDLDKEILEAYPCQQGFECTVVGQKFDGNALRSICNIIETDEEDDAEEDCR